MLLNLIQIMMILDNCILIARAGSPHSRCCILFPIMLFTVQKFLHILIDKNEIARKITQGETCSTA